MGLFCDIRKINNFGKHSNVQCSLVAVNYSWAWITPLHNIFQMFDAVWVEKNNQQKQLRFVLFSRTRFMLLLLDSNIIIDSSIMMCMVLLDVRHFCDIQIQQSFNGTKIWATQYDIHQAHYRVYLAVNYFLCHQNNILCAFYYRNFMYRSFT